MNNYREYILALKKCAAEHDNDDTPLGLIRISDLCRATAELLEKIEQESTSKNDLEVREFEKIVVEYPPEELCTYPEYKGKPYFGIKYKENGEEIVGYGTYNPEVLSRFLKDYFHAK